MSDGQCAEKPHADQRNHGSGRTRASDRRRDQCACAAVIGWSRTRRALEPPGGRTALVRRSDEASPDESASRAVAALQRSPASRRRSSLSSSHPLLPPQRSGHGSRFGLRARVGPEAAHYGGPFDLDADHIRGAAGQGRALVSTVPAAHPGRSQERGASTSISEPATGGERADARVDDSIEIIAGRLRRQQSAADLTAAHDEAMAKPVPPCHKAR